MIILIGTILGSTFAIYVLYAIWEFALFSRIMDDPVKGKTASLMAAFVTANVLTLLLWGSFSTLGVIGDVIGAAVVGFFGIRRGIILRDRQSESEAAAETFE